MIKKLKRIFDKKSLIKIYFLIIGLVFLALLETLSIGSIPLFISFIINPDLFIDKLSDLAFVPSILLELMLSYKSLFFINLLVIILFISKNVYFAFITYYQGYVLRDIIFKVSNKLFSLYMFSGYESISQNNSSSILNNLTNEVSQCFAFLNSLALILRESVVLLLLLSIVFLLSPFMTSLIFIIFLLISVIYFFILKKKLNEIGINAIRFKKEFLQSINEALGLFTDAKLLNKENHFIDNFKSKNFGANKTQHLRSFLTAMPRPILEVASVTILLGLTVFLFNNNVSTASIIPTLTLITVIALRLIPAFNVITSSITRMRSFYPSLDLIDQEFQKFQQKQQYIPNFKENLNIKFDKQLEFNKNIIEIRNFSFSYNVNNKKIFDKQEIFIKQNKFISIIGESGSGKSTLIMIILGLLKPTEGNVSYHSKIIDNNTNRPNIGYVPQSIFLKDDTIKNNIALGLDEKNINEEKVKEVIKLSQLNDFICSLDKGIETVVGERGSQLSGGQIQRIGLARALYNEPEVLILDEATNALDIKTEKIIDLLLPMRNKKTVIMITHRTWDMETFDHIIEVKNGKLFQIK